jgi:hypothetical protein
MKEKRSITINLLPQSEGAWCGISACVFFICADYAFNAMAGCQARETEANAVIASKATELRTK